MKIKQKLTKFSPHFLWKLSQDFLYLDILTLSIAFVRKNLVTEKTICHFPQTNFVQEMSGNSVKFDGCISCKSVVFHGVVRTIAAWSQKVSFCFFSFCFWFSKTQHNTNQTNKQTIEINRDKKIILFVIYFCFYFIF